MKKKEEKMENKKKKKMKKKNEKKTYTRGKGGVVYPSSSIYVVTD
jgi:hypothetical protein